MTLSKNYIVFIFILSLCLITIGVIDDKNRSLGCREPKVTGPCRNKLLRFAYDTSSGHCITFYYSGCGATKNNFLTYEECRRDCMNRSRY